tara:strand:- start:256 stop:1047 length:792 start_codon:yes stop_codon:yes gene_type:complete
MNYTLFAGCSYTYGTGFSQEKHDPDLWTNILHNKVSQLKKTTLLNVAISGRSNSGIFADAVFNITKHNCKYAFVEWTSSPRYELELGLELYRTRQVFSLDSVAPISHNLHDCTYSAAYLNRIGYRFASLAHQHYEIRNLVYYVNSLVAIAAIKGTKLFFINGLCGWDQCYFNEIENAFPDAYTEFTKKILNVATRDDSEIFAIYKKIHNQYNEYGGIQETHWLNLYRSMQQQRIDRNSDNVHPGKLSNRLYADQFSLELKHKL